MSPLCWIDCRPSVQHIALLIEHDHTVTSLPCNASDSAERPAGAVMEAASAISSKCGSCKSQLPRCVHMVCHLGCLRVLGSTRFHTVSMRS